MSTPPHTENNCRRNFITVFKRVYDATHPLSAYQMRNGYALLFVLDIYITSGSFVSKQQVTSIIIRKEKKKEFRHIFLYYTGRLNFFILPSCNIMPNAFFQHDIRPFPTRNTPTISLV